MAHLRNVEPIKTSKGDGWDIAWRQDGRFKQRRFYGTRKQAEKEANRVTIEVEQGRHFDDRQGRITFREVADEWLGIQTKAREVSLRRYRALLDTWILPEFGARQVRGITPGDVARFARGLQAAKPKHGKGETLRPATVRRICWPLTAILKYAVEEGYLPKDPSRRLALPTEDSMGVEPFEARALSWSEVRTLADAVGERYPEGAFIVCFLARTGLRAAEWSGLRVGDYDNGQLSIARTATRDSKVPGGVRVGAPKSKTSRRTLELDPVLADEVEDYLARHPHREDPSAWLFPSRASGGRQGEGLRLAEPFDWSRPVDPGTFKRRAFDGAAAAVGLERLRLHDLRHTCGSLLVAAGIGIIEVSRFLGHSSADFTAKRYVHVLDTSRRRTADRFAAYCAAEEAGKVVPINRASTG